MPQPIEAWSITVGALDNLDHNPCNTTAEDLFHGTRVSLFQFPTKLSTESHQATVKSLKTAKCNKLPESYMYTTVPAVVLKKWSTAVPDVSVSVSRAIASGRYKEAILSECSLLEHAMKLIAQIEVEKGDRAA